MISYGSIPVRCQRKKNRPPSVELFRRRPRRCLEFATWFHCLITSSTSRNIIDVAAMDSHNLEPQEYTDRVKLYSQKLAQQWNNVKHPNAPGPKGLLADVPAEVMLRKSTISSSDLQMVRRFRRIKRIIELNSSFIPD